MYKLDLKVELCGVNTACFGIVCRFERGDGCGGVAKKRQEQTHDQHNSRSYKNIEPI